jgi:hypothetical protein
MRGNRNTAVRSRLRVANRARQLIILAGVLALGAGIIRSWASHRPIELSGAELKHIWDYYGKRVRVHGVIAKTSWTEGKDYEFLLVKGAWIHVDGLWNRNPGQPVIVTGRLAAGGVSGFTSYRLDNALIQPDWAAGYR